MPRAMVVRVSAARALAVALVLGACSSSPRSEEDLKADFSSFVADKQACMADSDCTLASTGCPLGCATAVAKPFKDAVERRARELVSEYESNGRRCDYDCVAPDLRCEASRCTAYPPRQ